MGIVVRFYCSRVVIIAHLIAVCQLMCSVLKFVFNVFLKVLLYGAITQESWSFTFKMERDESNKLHIRNL